MATIKQKLAIKKVLKGTSITQAMKEVGYSKTTAETTTKLTRSKAWEELVESRLSDEELVKVHRAGLKATTKKPHMIDRDDKGRPIYDYIPEPDFHARHKYLETAYKIKRKFVPDGVGVAVQINFNDDREQYD